MERILSCYSPTESHAAHISRHSFVYSPFCRAQLRSAARYLMSTGLVYGQVSVVQICILYTAAGGAVSLLVEE